MKIPAIPKISRDQILEIMEYHPDLGLLWKVKRGRFASPGLPVGGKHRGQVRLGGVRVYSHHIVWFLHKGYWPSEKGLWIDHAEGIESEIIEHLRESTPSQNNSNRRNRDRYLPKGVTEQNGKFRSSVQFEERRYFLGVFDTEKEAEAAYVGASRVLHGEWSFHNRKVLSEAPKVVKIQSESGERS